MEIQLNGIWVGKFETTGTADSPTVKPNVASLRSQSTLEQFSTSQKFSSDTYGISSTSDSHMMKNSEWGAAAYLSHSKYGINSEIRLNNNSNFITGCGANTANASSSTNCEIVYGSVSEYPQSTTGNILGIFDMSGGSWERVMGNYNDTIGSSGFSAMPDSKYYDKYTTTDMLTACSGGICYGHGLSETYNWYGDYDTFISSDNPWLVRGGRYDDEKNADILAFLNNNGGAGSAGGFRSVITSN